MSEYNENNVEKQVTNMSDMLNKASDKIIKEFAGKHYSQKVKVIDNVLAFIGAAGGTGTSTIVANLAHTLSEKGMTVLVIDLNIMYPIQHAFFGLKQEVDKKDLVSFMLGKNDIGASIENLSTISVLKANNRYLTDYITCDTKQCSDNLVESIARIKHLFDVILIDCPRTIESDIVNSVLYSSDAIYTVWDEGIACISNLERMRKNMQVSGVDSSKIRVIMNKKTNLYYTKYVFEQLGLEVVETLPFDVAVIESSLRAEIFCHKGASMSKNAAAFIQKMDSLSDKVLEIGGYTK